MQKAKIWRQNCTGKFFILSDYHCLFYEERFFYLILNYLPANILSSRNLEHLLFPVGDPQEFTILNNPDITCVKPAIAVDHFGSKIRGFVVSHHYVHSPAQ